MAFLSKIPLNVASFFFLTCFIDQVSAVFNGRHDCSCCVGNSFRCLRQMLQIRTFSVSFNSTGYHQLRSGRSNFLCSYHQLFQFAVRRYNFVGSSSVVVNRIKFNFTLKTSLLMNCIIQQIRGCGKNTGRAP